MVICALPPFCGISPFFRKLGCIKTTPMLGACYMAFLGSISVICILIFLCYAVFIIVLRKTSIGTGNIKTIYRSLIVISLAVVFGYFSTTIIGYTSNILSINIESLYLNMTAGIFNDLGTAVTFFVYYAVSTEYRGIFDRLLGIGRLKEALCGVTSTTVQHMSSLPSYTNFFKRTGSNLH
ncbi:hypothetical protein COOONC_05175 [Cooperia oncophora]